MKILEFEKRTLCLSEGFREYLIIISPHTNIKNDVLNFKKEFVSHFGRAKYVYSIAHISLSNFLIESTPELTIWNELRHAFRDKKRFEVQTLGFQKFPSSNTLFIEIVSDEIIKLQHQMVAVLRKRAKIGNQGTQKIETPHITIASKIPTYQFDRSWNYFGQKPYSKTFMVDKITVLRKNHSMGESAYKLAFEIDLVNGSSTFA
ncbi:2'-5' RNA ligase family protein [Zobellia amurskyensis]|uniref:2'-5' RNA ligase family protein n=1 Tax=Zobellia amurskyensis TaxID=248905 RepID=A0A7X2ZTN0_9FLAO|nr:2'-5' RNA ligase family protein [Zobellia amurskyensis]MUH36191.1 2'-5' RNA ligase family protein [Zobellia amurskyensis]